MNLIDPIRRQAQAFPLRPAVVTPEGTMSYGDLWSDVAVLATNLRDQGVRRGQCVAITGIRSRGRLLLVLALAHMGAVSTAVASATTPVQRQQLFATNKAVAWVTRDTAGDVVNAPRQIDPAALFKALPATAERVPMESGLHDELWRIALSSGTTGSSKCIPWTHGQGAALQRLSLDIYPSGPRDRLAVFADLNIGLALGHAMQQLASGGAVIFPASLKPADIFDALRRLSPTRILTTPSMAAAMVTHAAGGNEMPATQGVLAFMLGGSALPPKLRADIEALFCPNIVVMYGSTEMGTTARTDLRTQLEHPSAAGRMVPWVDAQAVDAADNPLPAGETGLLRFRSPAMASGYLDSPEATARAFKSGWYYPGDTGSVTTHGILVLAGRQDDILNLNGNKIDPSQLEAVLNTHPEVADSAVTALRMQDGRAVLGLIVVPARPGAAVDGDAINAFLVNALGRQHDITTVLAVPQLPKTPAGKLARDQLPAVVREALAARAPKAG